MQRQRLLDPLVTTLDPVFSLLQLGSAISSILNQSFEFATNTLKGFERLYAGNMRQLKCQ